jgi:hypothetical protein
MQALTRIFGENLQFLVGLDLLNSLDGLIWLQSGRQVGDRFRQHQTTVSRNQKKCAQAFGLALQKQGGYWHLSGDTNLLAMEREVHQTARLIGHGALRLEANGWLGSEFCDPPPEGWIVGACKPIGVERSLALLHARIIDAWLCPLADEPSHDPALAAVPLCEMPLQLLVGNNHPLLRHRQLSLDAIRGYPWQRLPRGAYPGTQALLQTKGLWPPGRRSQSVDETLWDGLSEAEVTVQMGSVLSTLSAAKPSATSSASIAADLAPSPAAVVLPLDLETDIGVALVMRAEHADQPAIQALIAALLKRLQRIQTMHPELKLLRD